MPNALVIPHTYQEKRYRIEYYLVSAEVAEHCLTACPCWSADGCKDIYGCQQKPAPQLFSWEGNALTRDEAKRKFEHQRPLAHIPSATITELTPARQMEERGEPSLFDLSEVAA